MLGGPRQTGAGRGKRSGGGSMGAMQAVELEPEGGPNAVGAGEAESELSREPPGDDSHGQQAEAGRCDDQGWNTRFAALAEEHSRLLFRIAHGLLRNAHDAEDAVQEALLRIFRTGGAEMADEKAYLARTVWRAGLDIAARRPKRTEPIECDGAGGDGPMRELAAAGRSAEEVLAEGDERALLRRLIDALPEDLRQPLVLSAIEEMTSRQAAAALGIPEGTVRTRVMRARVELRRRFGAMQRRAQDRKATTDRHG